MLKFNLQTCVFGTLVCWVHTSISCTPSGLRKNRFLVLAIYTEPIKRWQKPKAASNCSHISGLKIVGSSLEGVCPVPAPSFTALTFIELACKVLQTLCSTRRRVRWAATHSRGLRPRWPVGLSLAVRWGIRDRGNSWGGTQHFVDVFILKKTKL